MPRNQLRASDSLRYLAGHAIPSYSAGGGGSQGMAYGGAGGHGTPGYSGSGADQRGPGGGGTTGTGGMAVSGPGGVSGSRSAGNWTRYSTAQLQSIANNPRAGRNQMYAQQELARRGFRSGIRQAARTGDPAAVRQLIPPAFPPVPPPIPDEMVPGNYYPGMLQPPQNFAAPRPPTFGQPGESVMGNPNFTGNPIGGLGGFSGSIRGYNY